jgi:hypothetical protein
MTKNQLPKRDFSNLGQCLRYEICSFSKKKQKVVKIHCHVFCLIVTAYWAWFVVSPLDPDIGIVSERRLYLFFIYFRDARWPNERILITDILKNELSTTRWIVYPLPTADKSTIKLPTSGWKWKRGISLKSPLPNVNIKPPANKIWLKQSSKMMTLENKCHWHFLKTPLGTMIA